MNLHDIEVATITREKMKMVVNSSSFRVWPIVLRYVCHRRNPDRRDRQNEIDGARFQGRHVAQIAKKLCA